MRQRQWAINQAVEHYAATTTGRTSINDLTRVRLQDLLEPQAVENYLQAAAEGKLRVRTPGPERTKTESPRTTAARALALRWLAEHTTMPSPAPLPQDTTLIDPSAELAHQLRLTITYWAETRRPTLVRAAAAAAIVASTAATTTDLANLHMSDVQDTASKITLPATLLHPLPHNFTELTATTARAQILPWAVPAVRAWLRHRKQLVGRLQGSDPKTVFVTCHANNQRQPPGLPLSVRGLTAAHATAVRRLAVHNPSLQPPATLAIARRVALANLLSRG